MSHLYRDTVDEKEKKGKKGSIVIGKKKRPKEGAETNVRYDQHCYDQENESISQTNAIWSKEMPSLSSLAMAGQCFDEVPKCKLKQPSNAVTLQLNHALSTPPDNFCL